MAKVRGCLQEERGKSELKRARIYKKTKWWSVGVNH